MQQDGRVRFVVHVQPRAARSEVLGVYGEAMKIRLAAVPVDGKANEELVKFLARLFAVSRRDVMIVAGHGSRSKIVEVAGVTDREVHDVVAGIAR